MNTRFLERQCGLITQDLFADAGRVDVDCGHLDELVSELAWTVTNDD